MNDQQQNRADALTDEHIATLKLAARAVTPQDIDGAERIESRPDGSYITCPACEGEGCIPFESDYCNYDHVAIGVQFYGVGTEPGAAEAYFRAAKPATILALLERLERLERAESALAAPPVEQPAAPPIVSAPASDARECLMDVVSHHHDFVTACKSIKGELHACGAHDSAAYWQKQIDVLDRMKAQAERALATSVNETGAEGPAIKLLREFMEYRDSDYVPNVLFDRARTIIDNAMAAAAPADERAPFDLTDMEWLSVFERVSATIPNVFGGYMKVRAAFAREAIKLADEARAAASPTAEVVRLEHVATAEDGGKLRWMTGRRPRDCELYARPDGGRVPATLYATPQPAQADAPAEAREPLNEVLFGNDEALEMAADALDRLGQDSAAAGVRALRMLAHKMRSAPADAGEARLTDAARDMLAERRRQVEAEGWTPEHDDQYQHGAIALAAACYAANAGGVAWADPLPSFWPWMHNWWKPTTPRRDLVKAGALILAELERLDRAALLNGADHDQ